MTAAEALRTAIQRLTESGIEGAPRDARLLLAHAMQIAPDRLTLHLPDEMSPEAQTRLDAALLQRLARQPVSQITGSRAFWGRHFRVTPAVLDPRPETELLISLALETPFRKVLDLGTGSGAIIATLLAERPAATGIGLDLSPEALEIAQQNARDLGVDARLEMYQSDWFSALPASERFDLIVSNPPYIAADEMADLLPEVRDWEPTMALTPGGDGLDAYRILAAQAGAFLQPQGRIFLEIGPTQGPAVVALLETHGFQNVSIHQDFDGRDRVVSGSWSH